ncbi:MAG TPA: DUF3090 family protein [Acidimicrobiales bacterium]|jgi:uncharacterized repeat protein (TIGR03847 family)|nr:DUF3090 family protein [Acidimicrobiales bacterium]
MPSLNESFDFPDPDHVVPAAIGEPGRRVFSIQIHQAGDVVALKCEKQQMIALAEHLEALVADLPPASAAELGEAADLEPAWAIGVLGLAYDRDLDRVVVMAQEVQVIEEGDAEGDEDPTAELDPDAATARIAMTRGQARRFIDTAVELVGAGRPTCPICGRPMDPAGHVCPRSNGHSPH